MITAAIRTEIHQMLGARGYLDQTADLSLYEYDGSIDKARPDVVVFPKTTAQVSALVKLAFANNLAIVILKNVTGHALKDAEATAFKTRRMFTQFGAVAASFDADQAHRAVLDEWIKQADGI